MGGLIQGIEALCDGAPHRPRSANRPPAAQARPSRSRISRQGPLVMLLLPSLPIIEIGAVTQVEAGHERPPEQRCRLRQARGALGAQLVGPVAMIDQQQLFHLFDIATRGGLRSARPWSGRYAATFRRDRFGGSTESSAALPCPAPAPIPATTVSQLLPGRLRPGDRQIGDQCDRLAGVHLEGLAVDGDLRGPQ